MLKYVIIILFITFSANCIYGQSNGWNKHENQLKIIPFGFASDNFQYSSKYKNDQLIVGIEYERELSDKLSFSIPFFISPKNFFIYTLPKIKLYPNAQGKRVGYISLGIAANNGKLNICVPGPEAMNLEIIDINRNRFGVFAGFGLSPKLSEGIRLNIDNNIGWYTHDNAFDYIGTNCNRFGKEKLPQLISSVGLSFLF